MIRHVCRPHPSVHPQHPQPAQQRAGTAFAYDGNGNLTSGGTNSYTYDPENRMVARSGGGTSASLRYDPLGRLYEVTGSSGPRRFLYDGDALVRRIRRRRRVIHAERPDQLYVTGVIILAAGIGRSGTVRFRLLS